MGEGGREREDEGGREGRMSRVRRMEMREGGKE